MNSIHTSNDTVPKDHHTEDNENHRTNLNEHNDDVTCDSDSSFLTDTQPTLSPRTPFVGIEDDATNLTNLTNPQTEDLNGTKSLAFRVLVDIFEDDQAPRACVVQIFATDTVENFKYALEKASGIPMDRQRCDQQDDILNQQKDENKMDPKEKYNSTKEHRQTRRHNEHRHDDRLRNDRDRHNDRRSRRDNDNSRHHNRRRNERDDRDHHREHHGTLNMVFKFEKSISLCQLY